MEYDYSLIEEKMKSLPDELQEAMVSFDTANKVQEIAKNHGLVIDQAGALADVTSYVMLGLIPSKNFVSELSKRAEIDEKTATEIAKDVNTEIFDGIRESLRVIEAREAGNNADVAKAGNMNVDKNLASENVVSGASKAPVEEINREAALNAIENPPAFIDRLLTGPTTSVTETVVKMAPAATAAPITPIAAPKPAPAAPSGPRIDPYREPLE